MDVVPVYMAQEFVQVMEDESKIKICQIWCNEIYWSSWYNEIFSKIINSTEDKYHSAFLIQEIFIDYLQWYYLQRKEKSYIIIII